jgi:hypothetical protein
MECPQCHHRRLAQLSLPSLSVGRPLGARPPDGGQLPDEGECLAARGVE